MQNLPVELITAIAEYIDPRKFALAATHINIAVCKSKSYQFFTKYTLTTHNLVKYGTVDSIKYVCSENSIKFPPESMFVAALNNNLAVVQWLHENQLAEYVYNAITVARWKGYHQVVQYLEKHYLPLVK